MTLFVVALLAGGGSQVLAARAAAADAASRRAMLDNIGRNVLAPAYADLAAKAAALSAASDALAAAPAASTLVAAQESWRQTLVAWRRAQLYAHGPVEELGIYPRIQFWPPRRQNIERVLRGQQPLTEAAIQELGANSVGLSTLEVLLFEGGADAAAQAAAFNGDAGRRRREYARVLGHDVAAQTAKLAGTWQGKASYAATFGAGGQEQLNVLVNDLVEAIEVGAANRLRLVLERHGEKQFRAELLEGGASGTSQTGLLALLTAGRAIALGGTGIGLDDYLRKINRPIAARLETQFQKAIDAVRALDVPLDAAAATREAAVARAHEACHTLEVMLKTEVASTLGVTLTFKAKDAD
ncbi:MAG TPA: imelysin family protein [Vicinamibacterales bacterium]|nr:imelysin family protein [Vicinamibacterales bacterium]